MVYFRFCMRLLFFFTLLFLITKTYSQSGLKMKVRADNGLVYFYKKGAIADSVLTKHNNQFHLVCRERQKKNILIHIENARLMPSGNDSTVFAEYLPGLKYEAWFVPSEDSVGADGTLKKGKTFIVSFLNGTTLLDRSRVRIQIYLKKENELVLENVYYYRN